MVPGPVPSLMGVRGAHPVEKAVLVHLGAGVGNVVLGTPLLVALHEMDFVVDLWLTADYPETIDLLRPWHVVRNIFTSGDIPRTSRRYAHILPAIPPFYWPRFGRCFAAAPNLVARPPQSLFYDREQEYYMHFARALGYPRTGSPGCTLPISQNDSFAITSQTVVLAPGCKTGEMAAKRWPHFPQLAEALADVVLVGTPDDLYGYAGTVLNFPAHVRSFIGKLTLRRTAELLAGAGLVVANDSGLAHVAAAVGAPTVILFGPTPYQTLFPFPPNVTVMSQGLGCQPCWFQSRFGACRNQMTCLEEIQVETIIEEIQRHGVVTKTQEVRQSA